MKKLNLKPGDTVEYNTNKYKVIENRIKKGKQKQSALIAINVIAILTMAAVYACYLIVIGLLGTVERNGEFGFVEMLLYLFAFLASFAVFIVAHEYVHYLTYRLLGGTAKDKLKFGVVLKMGMAYCIALEPNTVRASRLSLMMPFYVLVIPFIILSIVLQSEFLAILAAAFASGSGGDIWYMWTLRKDAKDKYMIESMPQGDGYEIGYLLLDKLD